MRIITMKFVGHLYITLAMICLPATALAIPGPKDVGARVIPIADNAYAGSSVNVVAGARQTLYTDSIYQYAGFYNADGKLVLAKRRLGEDHWQTQTTNHKVDVKDAHNTLSLITDGSGYLHVAWGHHNSPLSYAVSQEPGGLELGPAHGMLKKNEQSVTYPQFFRLGSGDLLLLYRDGGSGNGKLVINHFDTARQRWTRRQDNLIDGESERSAYWDMTVDPKGVLHLAWIWRETPDVASNHDIAYARSSDEGRTWQTSTGKDYKLPITAATAEIAVAIDQKHNLMNPPAIGADRSGRPFITSYWSSTPKARPRFHVVHHNDDGWHVIPGPQAGEDFKLQGWGTKRPPISRAALLVGSGWNTPWVALIYRDDSRGGRVIGATLRDLAGTDWDFRYLTEHNVGAWEPSVDPMQWQRMEQAHLLLQTVDQLDGDDASGSQAAPSDLGLLIWSTDWEKHQAQKAAKDTAAEKTRKTRINPEAVYDPARILDYAERVANWQWDNPPPEGWHFHPQGWGMCPLYLGTLAMAEYLPEAGLEERTLKRARANKFEPRDNKPYDADDYCVSQAYLKLYKKYREPEMLAPSRALLDKLMANPSDTNLDWGYPDSRDRWSWSDALFMGPMAWVLMWEVTGDERYLEFMNQEWWATTERLYRPEIGLYFRDESYLDLREKNGKTVHWSRGTAWVIAGLVQVIEHLPRDHPDYPRYLTLFTQMSEAFLAAQQPDGLWRPGLLDPQTHDAKETSGSAFASFAFMSGINQGLLDKERYLPAVEKAWTALTESVAENGKLRNVQPVGAGPHGFDPDNSAPFAAGAFLLLAKELYEFASAGGAD